MLHYIVTDFTEHAKRAGKIPENGLLAAKTAQFPGNPRFQSIDNGLVATALDGPGPPPTLGPPSLSIQSKEPGFPHRSSPGGTAPYLARTADSAVSRAPLYVSRLSTISIQRGDDALRWSRPARSRTENSSLFDDDSRQRIGRRFPSILESLTCHMSRASDAHEAAGPPSFPDWGSDSIDATMSGLTIPGD
jgi:hypothetical protein